MRVPGYGERSADVDVDELTYEAWSQASSPGFWAAHLLRQGYDEDLVLPGFGISEDVARAAFDEMIDPQRWPVFPVPLHGGAQLFVVYRNYEEDDGVDYLLADGAGGSLTLAALEGSFQGPGISWPELRSVAQGPGSRLDARKLLLLWPMLGDVSAGSEAVSILAEALREVGAAGSVDDLATDMVEQHPMLESPAWTEVSPEGSICDGEYSPRNPGSPVYCGKSLTLAG